ncbi:MAG: hypothetical protein LBR37_01335 [Erysipelotrichaceae bacterium]|jgi:hypothetical protein|nr:hypothetical protein [Erysipelotrichaceae bacterium]
MEIQIWDDDPLFDDLLRTVYTDNNGYYSVTFVNDNGWLENGYDIRVKVVFRNQKFEVFDDVFVYSYEFESISTNCRNGDDLNYSHIFDLLNNPSERDRAISVFQACTYGFEYLDSVNASYGYLSVQFESWLPDFPHSIISHSI